MISQKQPLQLNLDEHGPEIAINSAWNHWNIIRRRFQRNQVHSLISGNFDENEKKDAFFLPLWSPLAYACCIQNLNALKY